MVAGTKRGGPAGISGSRNQLRFQHDFRTDLFLEVRHERFLELGFIVGAYVRSSRESRDEGFRCAVPWC